MGYGVVVNNSTFNNGFVYPRDWCANLEIIRRALH